MLLGMGVGDGADGLVLLLVGRCAPCGGLGISHDDAAGVEVVIECLALAQELRREEQPEVLASQAAVAGEAGCVAHIQTAAVAHGDGALDHHDGIWVDLQNEVYHVLDVVCVKEVAL